MKRLASVGLLLAMALTALAGTKVIRERGDHWTAHAEYPVFPHPSKVQSLAGSLFRQDALGAVASFKKEIPEALEFARERDFTMFVRYRVEITFRSPSLVSGNGVKRWDPSAAHWFEQYYPRTVGVKSGHPATLTFRDVLLPGVDPVKLANRLVVPPINARKGKSSTSLIDRIPDREIDQFLVTSRGLKWVFWPYQVGSYAEGSFEVFVPWSKLRGFVNPKGPLKPAIPGALLNRSGPRFDAVALNPPRERSCGARKERDRARPHLP